MVVSTLLHNPVYSNFFLSCWTNDVEDFLKITWIIFPPSCQLRFSIFVLETFLIQEKENGNVVSTSHWIRPVITPLVIVSWEKYQVYQLETFTNISILFPQHVQGRVLEGTKEVWNVTKTNLMIL